MPGSALPTWDIHVERAFRAAAVEACRDGQETWVVAPFNLAQAYAPLVALAGAGYPLMALDWPGLATTLEQRLLLPHRPTASPLATTAATVKALRTLQAEGLLPVGIQKAVKDDVVGVAGALARSLAAIAEHAPELTAPPEAGPFVRANTGLLLDLKHRVAADLQAQGLTTGPLRWKAISRALIAGPCPALPARLILDGIDTLDRARADAVAALAACGVAIQAPPWLPLPGLAAVTISGPAIAAEPASAQVAHHRDIHEEVLGAVAWARGRIEAGAALADLALMVPPGAGYEALLHEAFGLAGLQVAAPIHTAVPALREIQALRAFASLRPGPLDVVDLVTLLGSSEVLTGAALLRVADQLYACLPGRLADVKDLPPEAREAVDRLALPARPLRVELEEFWERWVARPDPELVAACEEVLAIAEALHGPDLDLASWPATLEALLDVPARPGRFAPHALSVMHAGPYAPAPLAHLLVLGFNDGVFPGSMAGLPLLGASELAALAGVGAYIPSAVERAAWEMRNVWRLLAIAPDVTLSVPERGLAGTVLRPSPVLEQIVERPSPVAPPSLGSLPEWQLTVARTLATSAAPLPGVAPWASALFRAAPAFRLDPRLVERLARPLSPSSIDVLLQCPFAFYAKSLLRLEDRPVARALAWDAALSGTIGHRVLELMLEERTEVELRAEDVGPALARALADHPGLNPAAYRIQLELLRRELEAFVPRYAELARGLGATGGLSEWPFELELPLPDRKPVRVKGFIDRVVQRPGRPVAIDFKSGDVAKYRAQRAAGLGAQVAVYAWAVEQAALGRPAAFAYLTLGGRKVEVEAIASRDADLAGSLEVADAEPLEAFQERLLAALANQLDALEAGAIAPVTPERAAELDQAKAHPCRYCELELMCHSRLEPAE